MTKYYLIKGDQVVSTLDPTGGDVVALPLLSGWDGMSLMSEYHVQILMANLDLTAAEALTAMGIADLRESMLSSVFIASAASVNGADVSGLAAYHLVNISGDYSLWQVCGQQEDLLRLHAQLWAMAPTEALGLLAVVQSYGEAFYDAAVRTATGMTVEQAVARRDRIADYLESLGYTDTDALRAATTEGARMIGIVEALGYTEAQLWSAMVEPA